VFIHPCRVAGATEKLQPFLSILVGWLCFDFTIPKTKLAEVDVEAGKTYFLSFDVSSGLTFTLKYSLKNAEVGLSEISNCTLAESLETNSTVK